jgi:hypothetical protein
MTSRSPAPRVEEFDVPVCAFTGEVGCMDCVEGQCPGATQPPVFASAHRCTGCGQDDVYGQLFHDPSCPLYIPTEVPL